MQEKPPVTAVKICERITAVKICERIPAHRFPNYKGYIYVMTVADEDEQCNQCKQCDRCKNYKQYAYFKALGGGVFTDVPFESKLDICWFIGVIRKGNFMYGQRESGDELFRVHLTTGKITYHAGGRWVFVGNDAYISNADRTAIYSLSGKKYDIKIDEIVKWVISKDHRGYLITMTQHEKPCDANRWSSPYSYVIYSYPQLERIYEGFIDITCRSKREIVDNINIYEGSVEIHGTFIKINGFDETKNVCKICILD